MLQNYTLVGSQTMLKTVFVMNIRDDELLEYLIN